MASEHEQRYLEIRVPEASTLFDAYNLYRQAPECFVAGVQYALDNMLSRTSDLHDIMNFGNVLHANAVDILTQVKEKRL